MANFLLHTNPLLVVLTIVLPIIALIGGGALGIFVKDKMVKTKIGNANIEAAKILEQAKKEADAAKIAKKFEVQEEIAKLRQDQQREKQEAEREIKERRNEVQKSEHRIIQKEESLEKKENALSKKLDDLENQRNINLNREKELIAEQQKLKEKQDKVFHELERVAQLSKEEAKREVISVYEEEAKRDAAIIVREIENEAKEEADKKAKDIISLAIQKCAADHSSEMTVSVVNLPNDDMKGRIIGREGRNIRALENATGIDLIIDDTPEAIILSGFDPVRREIARISVEKLITDGRIHPARIEEIVEKTRKELELKIKETGESAAFETNVFGIHPELIKLLGRLKYRTSYGQNVLKHSIEVSHLAGLMAAELGGDVALAKRAGLLHDIGKAVDHEVEGTHISIGAELAKKYKENKEIVHCIAAHHNDIEPQTLEAILVQAADAISGARPGARRESLENYVKRLEKLEGIANSFSGVEKSFAIQAGREVRIIVKPEQINDEGSYIMAKEIAKKIESELDYPGQIKVNVIRELRSIEFAK